jgi:DNA-binding transcriptional ArsR family regulator
MSINKQIPDYDLDDLLVVTAPEQLRALADPLRGALLELPLERAATVTEMARAVGRPKSTVAYHVNLLVDAGLLRVVRTQRVRAIDERYYGRVARTFYIGALSRPEDMQVVAAINGIAEAAAESAPAKAADQLRCTRASRTPREAALAGPSPPRAATSTRPTWPRTSPTPSAGSGTGPAKESLGHHGSSP